MNADGITLEAAEQAAGIVINLAGGEIPRLNLIRVLERADLIAAFTTGSYVAAKPTYCWPTSRSIIRRRASSHFANPPFLAIHIVRGKEDLMTCYYPPGDGFLSDHDVDCLVRAFREST